MYAKNSLNRPSGAFRPEEVLFSPTEDCNLTCAHCNRSLSKKRLSRAWAIKFMDSCRRIGIKRVGFTGGEPFMAIGLVSDLVKHAVIKGYYFDRLMTNGVWAKDARELKGKLMQLRRAGYDGSICLSFDAFHGQNIKKAALFIKECIKVWARPDIVSLARVSGSQDKETAVMIKALTRELRGSISGSLSGGYASIKCRGLFIKIYKIDLTPVGKASAMAKPWGGRWFTEDRCKGPGHVFYVLPNGDVKPCCGYALDRKNLTIGNIKRDSASEILRRADKNRYVSGVFAHGLTSIRRKLECAGIELPGKTRNACFLCNYLLTAVPSKIMERCLVI